ncbi:hypothetical protein H4219_000337 [Mycoemilia scoparia]|uniref:Uncharacterized protein n=1 Tax=Mycoemilia scoparia TaxID=417184 RepID=A0A9W8A6B6_9FUNG|nr:hypothetical protein H4219_000337 [Mycoemilia scoparia]
MSSNQNNPSAAKPINIPPLNIRRASSNSTGSFNSSARTSTFNFGSSVPTEPQFSAGQSPVAPAFGLFRRFSLSGASPSSFTNSSPINSRFETSTQYLPTHDEMPPSNLDEFSLQQPLKTVASRSVEPQKKHVPSRPDTPMKQMILQGQFLD